MTYSDHGGRSFTIAHRSPFVGRLVNVEESGGFWIGVEDIEGSSVIAVGRVREIFHVKNKAINLEPDLFWENTKGAFAVCQEVSDAQGPENNWNLPVICQTLPEWGKVISCVACHTLSSSL